jgi:MoxR-like ATPase
MTTQLLLDRHEVAERIAELEFAPNATYPKPPSGKDFWDLDIVKAFLHGIATGQPFRFLGDPGVGKTAFVLWMAKELGLKVVYIPAALIAPEDLAVPMPHKGEKGMELDFLLYKELTCPDAKVIIIDELSRATKQVQNQLLELVQQKRLADIPIPNVIGMFSMDNEGKENGITAQPDFTQSDRWATVKVDSNKIPWRWGLANQEEFRNVDLTSVYRVYARLSPSVRKLLSPRVLEHVMYNGLRGHPLIWGLPIQAGHEGPDGSSRVLLVDENGHDVTDETLDSIASALGVQNRTHIGDPLERALKAAFEDHKTLFVEGAPGTGKTAYIREMAEATGAKVLILSGPVISPDNLVIPFPSDGELDMMILKFLADPGRKIIVIDEIWRSSASVRNKLMEITQQGTIGGREIEDLVTVIGINNPKTIAGYKLEVGRADRAQVERFDMNLEVDARDVPAKSWLLRTYGEEAEPFIEWLEEDLDDLGRVLITKRGIERLIELARSGLPLEWAKPYMDGEYVPVPLMDLESRLAQRPVARLRAVAAKVDEYEDQLQSEGDNTRAQTEVYFAFSRADETQLEEHREVCVRLLRHMSQQHVINLLRPSGKRQTFWHQVLRDAHGKATAKKK